jgi:hypothetical protein
MMPVNSGCSKAENPSKLAGKASPEELTAECAENAEMLGARPMHCRSQEITTRCCDRSKRVFAARVGPLRSAVNYYIGYICDS